MSSKTPKANAAKTASAPNYIHLTLGVLLVLALCSLFSEGLSTPVLLMGHNRFNLEVARTEESQELGLSDRLSLAEDDAMLFVFPKPDIKCFWMKDMHFPIDILWLDSNKRVMHMELGLSPDSYPNSYCPSIPSSYTVEVNAGMAKQNDVRIGSKLIF